MRGSLVEAVFFEGSRERMIGCRSLLVTWSKIGFNAVSLLTIIGVIALYSLHREEGARIEKREFRLLGERKTGALPQTPGLSEA